jgi:hypothetical protein
MGLLLSCSGDEFRLERIERSQPLPKNVIVHQKEYKKANSKVDEHEGPITCSKHQFPPDCGFKRSWRNDSTRSFKGQTDERNGEVTVKLSGQQTKNKDPSMVIARTTYTLIQFHEQKGDARDVEEVPNPNKRRKCLTKYIWQLRNCRPELACQYLVEYDPSLIPMLPTATPTAPTTLAVNVWPVTRVTPGPLALAAPVAWQPAISCQPAIIVTEALSSGAPNGAIALEPSESDSDSESTESPSGISHSPLEFGSPRLLRVDQTVVDINLARVTYLRPN